MTLSSPHALVALTAETALNAPSVAEQASFVDMRPRKSAAAVR